MQETVLHIKDGQATNGAAIRKFFSELSDGKYLLGAKSIKTRSLQQNAYYHGIVIPMVKDGLRAAGYNEVKTNEDAHEILKHLFLKKRFKSESDENEIVVAGSTAKLKTVEFNEYLEEIWQWAAQYLSIHIPAPNEQSIMFASYDYDLQTTIVD